MGHHYRVASAPAGTGIKPRLRLTPWSRNRPWAGLEAWTGSRSGHAASVVVTVRVWSPKCDEFEAAAEGLHIAGDRVDGGQFAALDLGYPSGGDVHGVGELGLGEAAALHRRREPAGEAVAVAVLIDGHGSTTMTRESGC